jgi:hypothetical protein
MAPVNPKAEEIEKELEELYQKASEASPEQLVGSGLVDDRTPDVELDPKGLAPESTEESTAAEGTSNEGTPAGEEIGGSTAEAGSSDKAGTDGSAESDKITVHSEEEELRRWQKRYRDVQSWADRTNAENAMLKKRLADLEAQTKTFVEKLKQAPEQITETQKEILEEFPELGEKLPKLLNELVGPQIETVKSQVEALQQEKALLEQQMLRSQIVAHVPDFDEIRSSRYFQRWLESDGETPNDLSRAQKEAILASSNPMDAVRLFNQFKEEFSRNVIARVPREDRGGTVPPPPPEPSTKDVAEATAEPRQGKRNPFVMPVEQRSQFDLDKIGSLSVDEFDKNRDLIYQQAQEVLKNASLI